MSDQVFRTTVTDPDRMRAALEENKPIGEVELLVAAFGEPDTHTPVGLSERQVIDAGAFRTWIGNSDFRTAPVPIFADHGMAFAQHGIALASLKLGKATDFTEADQGLVVRGSYNLQKQLGREMFSDLIHDPTGAQFSFRWPPTEKTYRGADGYEHVSEFERVDEVSQVGFGAQASTALVSIRAAIASHSTGTSTDRWDGPANVRRCPNTRAALRKLHAWVDPDGDPESKSSYKFPHHQVSEGGDVGAANLRGCSAGVAVLNGERGGADIPDGDRAGVYRHLAAHIRSAGNEPPALRSSLTEWGWTQEDVTSLLMEPTFRDAFIPAAVGDMELRTALREALEEVDRPDAQVEFEKALFESLKQR